MGIMATGTGGGRGGGALAYFGVNQCLSAQNIIIIYCNNIFFNHSYN